MVKKTFKALALAGAASVLLSPQAWAANDLMTVGVSLSHLTYELIDLNPNDSVAPTVTFKTPIGSTWISEYDDSAAGPRVLDQTTEPVGIYDKTRSIDFTHAQGKASFGADGISMQMNYSLDKAKAAIAAHPMAEWEKQPYGDRGDYMELGQQLLVHGNDVFSFRLGANTAIVFKGRVTASVSIDETVARTFIDEALPANGSVALQTWGRASVYGVWDRFADNNDSRDNERTWGTAMIAKSKVSPSAVEILYQAIPDSRDESFQITITNDDWMGTPKDAVVSIGMEVSQSLYVYPPPIPEPASGLMWTLGLTGLACVSRKRKRQPRH